jgi:hypothetical protein
VQNGPAFISWEIEGSTAAGGDVFLKRLVNPDDVSKLVVFDTWIRNPDRCPPEGLPNNRDNLFFTPIGRKFDLVALDHSHCFVETTLADELGQSHLLADESVYGFFPEFRPYIDTSAVRRAARRLLEIDMGTVKEIVGSVPPQWGVTAGSRDAWAKLICDRAERVAKFLPAKLGCEPELDL